jgi:hypothetical protein
VTDLAELLLLTIFGRILIFLWMEFPLPRWADSIEFIHKLHSCDLCSGVWGYTILFLIFNVDILQMLGLPHIIFIGGLLTGGAISFLVHLVTIGYRTKFSSIVIE